MGAQVRVYFFLPNQYQEFITKFSFRWEIVDSRAYCLFKFPSNFNHTSNMQILRSVSAAVLRRIGQKDTPEHPFDMRSRSTCRLWFALASNHTLTHKTPTLYFPANNVGFLWSSLCMVLTLRILVKHMFYWLEIIQIFWIILNRNNSHFYIQFFLFIIV